jgi:FAD/FMN-containing dehydrogenase
MEQAIEAGVVTDAAIAASIAQSKDFWALRESIPEAQVLEGGNIKHDIAVPISSIGRFIDETSVALERGFPGIRMVVFGHLGDGNLHVVFAPRAGGPGEARREVEEIVYRPLAALGGAVSAEHGIGLEKKAWLGITRTPAEIALMALLKRTLDPRGLLNRGKVVDPG